jgi:hypothetical protein
MNNLKKCDILVAHYDAWDALVKNAKCGAVCIRVSTAGFSAPHYQPPSRFEREKIVILHLVSPSFQLKKECWIEILKGLSEPGELDKLISGREWTPLRRYFLVGCVDHLRALAVLCQAYLVIYAEFRDGKWGPPDIEQALMAMELPGFVKGNSAGAQRMLKQLQREGEKLRTIVTKGQWWHEVFGQSDPVQVIGVEWGEGRKGWEDLVCLLDAIKKNRDIAPDVVGKAFLALKARLEHESV